MRCEETPAAAAVVFFPDGVCTAPFTDSVTAASFFPYQQLSSSSGTASSSPSSSISHTYDCRPDESATLIKPKIREGAFLSLA